VPRCRVGALVGVALMALEATTAGTTWEATSA
jgi:hypothetical protein